ncbi:MAG: hypothetical protein IKO22_07295 [Oscillospiraceae bacterium]|nr:hypothetical protein [Oscillospiraceae bacterium]
MDRKDTMAEGTALPAAGEAEPLTEQFGQTEPSPRDEEREAMREFIRRDAEEFRRQYPDVDLRELDADPLFRLFCGSRYGKEPLADLYGDYLALTERAELTRRRRESRYERATGSGGSGGGEALTAAEQRELNEWNKAYPQMKMSAKEYLDRA